MSDDLPVFGRMNNDWCRNKHHS